MPSFRGLRAGGSRGCKDSLYEGGTRMPFIVRWPGHVPAGRVDETTVIGGVDLFPMFCQLAGVPLPKDASFDGEDLSKSFFGQTLERSKALFWEYGRNENLLPSARPRPQPERRRPRRQMEIAHQRRRLRRAALRSRRRPQGNREHRGQKSRPCQTPHPGRVGMAEVDAVARSAEPLEPQSKIISGFKSCIECQSIPRAFKRFLISSPNK